MTPQTLFSTDIIIYQPILNLDTIQPSSKQWDMELTQMHKDSSHVTLEAVHTPRIQLGHTYYSQALLIKGAFPPKSILLFYTKTDAELTFQNSSVQKYELIISDSGDELDFLTKSQSEVFTIAIEETLFYEAFFSFFGDELKLFLQKKRFFIRPEMASTFIDGISSWISYLKTKPALLTQKNYDAVETAILKHIFSTLQIEKRLKARLINRTRQQRSLSLTMEALIRPLNCCRTTESDLSSFGRKIEGVSLIEPADKDKFHLLSFPAPEGQIFIGQLGILRGLPRLTPLQVLVGGVHRLENRLQRAMGLDRIHVPIDGLHRDPERVLHLPLEVAGLVRLGNPPVREAAGHVEGAADEVAEVVGEVRVDARDEPLFGGCYQS